jgi:uncharacterized protein (UPF0332 family)
MSTSVSDIIGLASRLVESKDGNAPEEVELRCSTSRAYYAALHAAEQALPSDLTVTPAVKRGRSSHQAIIDAVVLWAKAVRPGRQEAISVARNLPKLRDARKKADYSMGADFTLEDANATLKIAISTVESAARAAQMAMEKQA